MHSSDIALRRTKGLECRDMWCGMSRAAHDSDPPGLLGQDGVQDRPQVRPVVVGDDDIGIRAQAG
jgi:hypothetical protein